MVEVRFHSTGSRNLHAQVSKVTWTTRRCRHNLEAEVRNLCVLLSSRIIATVVIVSDESTDDLGPRDTEHEEIQQ